ncbi:hypothetical protein GYH30_039007 [Glycine max]|nr:hypothetical protein GYH30_039007 [Glycine max]
MKWCDHCCRFSQTRVENIIHESWGKYCSSCTMCGKILLDLGRNPRRIKKRRKSNVKIVKKELDAASKGPLIKEAKQPINSDTTQVSLKIVEESLFSVA